MHRFVVLAAGRHRHCRHVARGCRAPVTSTRSAPPVAQSAPVMQPAVANRPVWAAPQQCYTDDGYGRFLPCDVGDGR